MMKTGDFNCLKIFNSNEKLLIKLNIIMSFNQKVNHRKNSFFIAI